LIQENRRKGNCYCCCCEENKQNCNNLSYIVVALISKFLSTLLLTFYFHNSLKSTLLFFKFRFLFFLQFIYNFKMLATRLKTLPAPGLKKLLAKAATSSKAPCKKLACKAACKGTTALAIAKKRCRYKQGSKY
jgi:hypothetical protein